MDHQQVGENEQSDVQEEVPQVHRTAVARFQGCTQAEERRPHQRPIIIFSPNYSILVLLSLFDTFNQIKKASHLDTFSLFLRT